MVKNGAYYLQIYQDFSKQANEYGIIHFLQTIKVSEKMFFTNY